MFATGFWFDLILPVLRCVKPITKGHSTTASFKIDLPIVLRSIRQVKNDYLKILVAVKPYLVKIHPGATVLIVSNPFGLTKHGNGGKLLLSMKLPKWWNGRHAAFRAQ
jgi:hypothetical protein